MCFRINNPTQPEKVHPTKTTKVTEDKPCDRFVFRFMIGEKSVKDFRLITYLGETSTLVADTGVRRM